MERDNVLLKLWNLLWSSLCDKGQICNKAVQDPTFGNHIKISFEKGSFIILPTNFTRWASIRFGKSSVTDGIFPFMILFTIAKKQRTLLINSSPRLWATQREAFLVVRMPHFVVLSTTSVWNARHSVLAAA